MQHCSDRTHTDRARYASGGRHEAAHLAALVELDLAGAQQARPQALPGIVSRDVV